MKRTISQKNFGCKNEMLEEVLQNMIFFKWQQFSERIIVRNEVDHILKNPQRRFGFFFFRILCIYSKAGLLKKKNSMPSHIYIIFSNAALLRLIAWI